METRERNITWEIHPLPAVRADRALLRLVLVNLISNAVEFTGARAQAKIEIGCAPGGDGSPREIGGAAATGPAAEAVSRGETVILIRDNGAGFDPRYAGRLFGVFQRLHNQDKFEGTGIGGKRPGGSFMATAGRANLVWGKSPISPAALPVLN